MRLTDPEPDLLLEYTHKQKGMKFRITRKDEIVTLFWASREDAAKMDFPDIDTALDIIDQILK